MRAHTSFSFRASLVAVVVFGLGRAAPSWAQTTVLEDGRYSPDVTLVVGGVTVSDEDVVSGDAATVDLGPLSRELDVVAYHEDTNGDRLFSLEAGTTLPGGLVVRPGDVVRYDGLTYVLELDAAAVGLPRGARVDAVSLTPDGELVVSLDTTIVHGGILIEDRDLAVYGSGGFTVLLAGAAQGIPRRLDIDAAQVLGDEERFLVSFDTSGSVGGVTFDDDDVLELDAASGSWVLAREGGSPSADLDGLFVPASPSSRNEICSTLGDNRVGFVPDLDVFTLEGSGGETIGVELQPSSDAPTGELAALIVRDGIRRVRFVERDDSALPNDLNLVLPATGRYWLIVAQPFRRSADRFEGGYCLAVDSDAGAAATLTATASVEP